MKQPKQRLISIVSLLLLFGPEACSKPDMLVHDESVLFMQSEDGGPLAGESFNEKIRKLSRIKGVEVRGTINVSGRGKNVQGSFVMFIDGDNMDMVVHSKGIMAGSIDLKGNVVKTSPSLNDEYIEYMFAVILRDSVTWWNIHGYDILNTDTYHIMRNSWKKLYISAVTLVPEKQIVRLTKHREAVITYGDMRNFGFGLMPSTIAFGYNDLACRLSLESLEIREVVRQSQARGPSQQS